MNRTKLILAAILFCAVLAFLGALMASPTLGESQEALAKGNTAFAVDLFRELCSSEGNLFFSPYSITSALGMTFAGARENTAKEMKDVLHFGLSQSDLPSTFKNLNRDLKASACMIGQKLNIANGLCLTGGYASDEFKNLLKDNFDAEVFTGGLEKVNNWVKQKTEGKIEKILEALSPNSVCVLLNAIYFKGTWDSQFEKGDTREAPFKLASKKQVTVPLMYQKSNFKLLSKRDFQIIEIPYRGKGMAMIVILPKDVDGLTKFEGKMTTANLTQWFAELDSTHAQEAMLLLPKFKLKTSYSLVSHCKNLGMKDAFEVETADFSGMGWPKGKLWISQIKHKAFVEVNEEGTEAAAATAVEMQTKSIKRYPIFRADHPFLFLIRENTTGSLLFVGRMADPTGT